jgi:hypothetical protein
MFDSMIVDKICHAYQIMNIFSRIKLPQFQFYDWWLVVELLGISFLDVELEEWRFI